MRSSPPPSAITPLMARPSSRLARGKVLSRWSTNLWPRELGASRSQHPAVATIIPTAVAGVRHGRAWLLHVQSPEEIASRVPEPNHLEYLRLPLMGKSLFRVIVDESCGLERSAEWAAGILANATA